MHSILVPPLLRLSAMIFVAAVALALIAGPAKAHVRVHADSTASGSFSQLTFRVPNESRTAGTTRVAVRLPQDKPFLFVSIKPVPGWKGTIQEAPLPKPVESGGTTITKAARTVTWTAVDGTRIEPGEYQEFAISVGPLPATGQLMLPATQTYSDGKVVSWDEPTPASGEEPERPAPALEVTAPDAASDGHGAAGSGDSGSEASVSGTSESDHAADSTSARDTVARWLGGAALAVALAALVLAALTLIRAGRSVTRTGGSA
jgi:periplasmic copper chaperone A